MVFSYLLYPPFGTEHILAVYFLCLQVYLIIYTCLLHWFRNKWNMIDIDYGGRTMTKYKVVWAYKDQNKKNFTSNKNEYKKNS